MTSFLSTAAVNIADNLIGCTLFVAILVSIAWGIITIGRIKAPVYRHLVWFLTMFAITTMPGIWLHGPKFTLPILPTAEYYNGTSTPQIDFSRYKLPVKNQFSRIQPIGPSIVSSAASFSRELLSFNAVKFWIVGTWGIGILIMTIRLLVGWHRFSCIARSAIPIEGANHVVHQTLSQVEILLSPRIASPISYGFTRPKIFLPVGFYQNAAEGELRMVLSHELSHILRRDGWMILLQRFMEAVFFFHPLVWYASLQLTQQREQICDNHVIAAGTSPTNYVRLLARIAEKGFERNCLQAAPLLEGKLLSRARRLLEQNEEIRLKPPRSTIISSAMVFLICLVIGMTRFEAEAVPVAKFESLESRAIPTSVETISEITNFTIQAGSSEAIENKTTGSCFLCFRIFSSRTSEPIENENVYFFYQGKGARTFIRQNDDGYFRISNHPNGKYKISAMKIIDPLLDDLVGVNVEVNALERNRSQKKTVSVTGQNVNERHKKYQRGWHYYVLISELETFNNDFMAVPKWISRVIDFITPAIEDIELNVIETGIETTPNGNKENFTIYLRET